MSVLQKTYRKIMCDGCNKSLTEFSEDSSYTIRHENKIKKFNQRDYCDTCYSEIKGIT